VFEHATQICGQAERIAAAGKALPAVLGALRRLSLEDYGALLFSMPNEAFPALSAVLPRMASADIQKQWTGTSGQALLNESVLFLRTAWNRFQAVQFRQAQPSFLDFGCGYGRFMRLMSYFTDPENIVGVDPWQQSLDFCREAGVFGELLRSEVQPKRLPVGDRRFDLVLAYSVFTHLPEKIALAAFAAIRRSMARNGVFVFTIRPIDYWAWSAVPGRDVARLAKAHRTRGFAFSPLTADAAYGDASMSFAFLSSVPGWRMVGYDLDGVQLAITFVPE
jgi:SAM-dependent methyltransferase